MATRVCLTNFKELVLENTHPAPLQPTGRFGFENKKSTHTAPLQPTMCTLQRGRVGEGEVFVILAFHLIYSSFNMDPQINSFESFLQDHDVFMAAKTTELFHVADLH